MATQAFLDVKAEFKKMLRDMSNEEILDLIRDARKEKHTGYEKVKEYFYIGVDGGIHKNIFPDCSDLYDCANYYSDVDTARACSRADTLMRKLRRFAAEHDGCSAPGDPGWYITYYYPDETLDVMCVKNNWGTPGVILFKSKKAAQDAINEFADELNWYFNCYNPMPIPHDWVRANDCTQ